METENSEINPEIEEKSIENDEKFRIITVENLRHPGGWISNRQFQSLLNRCVNYSATFSREEYSDERQIKSGKVEILFSSVETARDAYMTLQKLIIDGMRPLTIVDKDFFSSSISSTSSDRKFFENPSDPRVVFLLDAPESIDENMISYFFNGEIPIHFQTLPMPTQNGLFQVEILFSDGGSAEKILAGPSKFQMNEEGVEYNLTLISPREYVLYSKMDEIRQPSTLPLRKENPQIQLAPEIDEEVVVNRLMEIIDQEKINFAEINEKDELYELCDQVSAEYNGLPDSILKPSMGSVLQRHLNRTEMHWMREHIEGLLRFWKMEILNETKFERPTFVPMETVDYKPVIQENTMEKEGASKGAQKRQRAARAQMGVGAFLSANRERLIVESGDVEMDSDDDGNVVIGGEALSFDSWARITKTKASGVVRANDDGTRKIGNGGLTRKQMRMARRVEGMSQEEWKKWRNEKSANRKMDIKQRIMNKGAMIEGEDVQESESKDPNPEADQPTSSDPPAPPPVKRDLDEGEIDSEEERKEKEALKTSKKRKPTSSSSDSSDSSSSSSSEEDPDGPVDSRKRRKMRRKKDRKNPMMSATSTTSSQLDPNFRQMFENRKAIIAQMSPAHKAAFASALTQIAQSSEKASQVITSMMSGFK